MVPISSKMAFSMTIYGQKTISLYVTVFSLINKRFSNSNYARTDGFNQNIMRSPMVFYFYYARLQSREFLPLITARDNRKIRKRTGHDDIELEFP